MPGQGWHASQPFLCAEFQEKQIVLEHHVREGNMLELCLLTRVETEVTVSYNKSCLGEGNKGKSEYIEKLIRLLRDQTEQNVGTRASGTTQILICWAMSSLRKGLCNSCICVSLAVSIPGPHVQYLLKNSLMNT